MREVLLSALIKAARTGVQAFLGVFAVAELGDFSLPVLRGVLVAAAAAGFAAAWRVLLDTLPVPSLVDRWGTAGTPQGG